MDLKQVADKCITDFEFFCAVCLTVAAKNYKVEPNATIIQDIPFKLSKSQKAFVKYLSSQPTDKVILKPRQRGYSTLLLAYCLWRVLYGYNENILYLIDKEAKANNFRRIIQQLFDSMPPPLKPNGVTIRASNEIYNDNRHNHLSLKPATSSVGRAGTHTLGICDEYAYYDANIQEDLAASLVASCQNRIWISTPAKENDKYHQKVLAAEKEGTLWKEDYWTWAEDWYGTNQNAKLWRREQEKNLTQAQIAREYDCLFRGAAEDLIWYLPVEALKPNRNADTNRMVVSFDVGWDDDTAVLFAKEYGYALHIIDELVLNETAIPDITAKIKETYSHFKYGVVDSAAKKVDQTSGISIHADLQKRLGCKFYTGKPQQIEGIQLAQTALLEHRIYIDPKCVKLIEALNNYEWEGDKLPKHHYKHLHDSFVYLVYNWLKRGANRLTAPKMIPRSVISKII